MKMELETETTPAKIELPGVSRLTEIEAVLAGLPKRKTEIAELVKSAKGITVKGHAEGPKKGREATHSKLMEFVAVRVATEKDRVAAKAPVVALGKFVDAEFAEVLKIGEAAETALRSDRDAYDNEQKAIEAARLKAIADKAEADRIEKLKVTQDRIRQIIALRGTPDLLRISDATDDEFAAMLADAKTAFEAAQAKEEAARIERERLEKEAEAKREQERKDREEAERIAREQREAEDKARRERDEKERAEREARDAEAARLRAIEDARIAAEREAERAAIEKERAELAEARRKVDEENARIAAEKEAAEKETNRYTWCGSGSPEVESEVDASECVSLASWLASLESVLLDAPAVVSPADAVRRDRILSAVREALDATDETERPANGHL